jgi:hypothetical protein
MTPRPPKDFGYWKATLTRDWPSRAILTLLTLFCGYVWSQGDNLVKKKIIDTVKPYLDTLAKKVETTDQKVEKLDDKMNALIDVMSEAFPEFKKAAKERAQQNRDSKDVQDALTGEAP